MVHSVTVHSYHMISISINLFFFFRCSHLHCFLSILKTPQMLAWMKKWMNDIRKNRNVSMCISMTTGKTTSDDEIMCYDSCFMDLRLMRRAYEHLVILKSLSLMIRPFLEKTSREREFDSLSFSTVFGVHWLLRQSAQSGFFYFFTKVWDVISMAEEFKP